MTGRANSPQSNDELGGTTMTVLDLDKDMTSADDAAPEIRQEAAGTGDNGKILRFYQIGAAAPLGDRGAVPGLLCHRADSGGRSTTPSRNGRIALLFSWMHRASGLCSHRSPLAGGVQEPGGFPGSLLQHQAGVDLGVRRLQVA